MATSGSPSITGSTSMRSPGRSAVPDAAHATPAPSAATAATAEAATIARRRRRGRRDESSTPHCYHRAVRATAGDESTLMFSAARRVTDAAASASAQPAWRAPKTLRYRVGVVCRTFTK